MARHFLSHHEFTEETLHHHVNSTLVSTAVKSVAPDKSRKLCRLTYFGCDLSLRYQTDPEPTRSGWILVCTRDTQTWGEKAMVQPRAQTETMQQKVYQELRHSLMVGAFVPGQPVSLRKLSESLQTSLMPVREAVNLLIAERAFEMMPNRKVVIPDMSEKKLSELMYWRKVLEGKAAEQACKQVTQALIKKVVKINDELTKAVEADDFHLTLIKNQEFHFAIYEAADNSILLPMIESLWLQGGPSIYFSLVSPNVLWNGQFHLQAVDALKAKDPQALREAIENDIQVTAEFLLKSHMLRRVKPRPIS